MRRVRLWPVFLLLAQALVSFSAKGELRLSTLTAGTNTYSNTVITSSSNGRVLVDHERGMAAIRVADLNLETQHQLATAGLVQPELSKQIEKEVAKRATAKKRAARSSSAAPAGLTIGNAEKTSIAKLLAQQVKYQAEQNGIEFSLEWLQNRFGGMTIGLAAAALLMAGIFRRILFFRVCKNATSDGSFLVFIPVVRWLDLTSAARMSKQWLGLPAFAILALFLPPPVLQQYPWVAKVYLGFIAVLWLVTIVLYLVWCVRLCQSVNRSAGWAFLLFFPLLDYVALVVLAFSEGQPAVSGDLDPLRNPVLAI